MVESAALIVASRMWRTWDQLHFFPKGQWQHPNVSCKWCRSPKKLLIPYFPSSTFGLSRAMHAIQQKQMMSMYVVRQFCYVSFIVKYIYDLTICFMDASVPSWLVLTINPPGSPITSRNWSSLFSYNTMLGRRYLLPTVFLVIQLILISIVSQQAHGADAYGCKC